MEEFDGDMYISLLPGKQDQSVFLDLSGVPICYLGLENVESEKILLNKDMPDDMEICDKDGNEVDIDN